MFQSQILRRGVFCLAILFATVALFAASAFAANTIAGTVYDKANTPLPDVDVELLDEYYRLLPNGRQKTTGSGRYQFDGLNSGRFYVRVYAFRYDLVDQTQEIYISSISADPNQVGSSYNLLDFYLLPKKGGLAETELGVVFAQNVPDEAKKLYERGLKEIAAKRVNDGIMSLNEAVQKFPTYYLALHRVGRELFMLKKYSDAIPFLLKAAEVNPKSATTLYYLGSSLHKMGKEYNKAALRALNQALVLAPASTQVLYALGKTERDSGKFAEAEQHLLQAKKLSKVGIPEIHKELAQLYSDDLKKYKEAADELELYLKVSKLGGSEADQTKKVIANLRAKAKTPSTAN